MLAAPARCGTGRLEQGEDLAEGFRHTLYKGGQWINEIEGGASSGPHSTTEEAVSAGRTRARENKTEHVIHTTGIPAWLGDTERAEV